MGLSRVGWAHGLHRWSLVNFLVSIPGLNNNRSICQRSRICKRGGSQSKRSQSTRMGTVLIKNQNLGMNWKVYNDTIYQICLRIRSYGSKAQRLPDPGLRAQRRRRRPRRPKPRETFEKYVQFVIRFFVIYKWNNNNVCLP